MTIAGEQAPVLQPERTGPLSCFLKCEESVFASPSGIVPEFESEIERKSKLKKRKAARKELKQKMVKNMESSRNRTLRRRIRIWCSIAFRSIWN